MCRSVFACDPDYDLPLINPSPTDDDNEPSVVRYRDETRRFGTLQGQKAKNRGAEYIVPVKRTEFSSINK